MTKVHIVKVSIYRSSGARQPGRRDFITWNLNDAELSDLIKNPGRYTIESVQTVQVESTNA